MEEEGFLGVWDKHRDSLNWKDRSLVTPEDKAKLKQYNPTKVWQSKSKTIQPHKNLLVDMSHNFNFILLTSEQSPEVNEMRPAEDARMYVEFFFASYVHDIVKVVAQRQLST